MSQSLEHVYCSLPSGGPGSERQSLTFNADECNYFRKRIILALHNINFIIPFVTGASTATPAAFGSAAPGSWKITSSTVDVDCQRSIS